MIVGYSNLGFISSSLLDSIDFLVVSTVEMNREECKVPKEVYMELNTWPSQVSGSRVPGTQGEMDPLRRQKEKKKSPELNTVDKKLKSLE
jgi:hypothetical protein